MDWFDWYILMCNVEKTVRLLCCFTLPLIQWGIHLNPFLNRLYMLSTQFCSFNLLAPHIKNSFEHFELWALAHTVAASVVNGCALLPVCCGRRVVSVLHVFRPLHSHPCVSRLTVYVSQLLTTASVSMTNVKRYVCIENKIENTGPHSQTVYTHKSVLKP